MIIIGSIFALLFYIGIAAIFVWIADWVSVGDDLGNRSALKILDQRLANGEIDKAEYEAQRKLLGGRTGAR